MKIYSNLKNCFLNLGGYKENDLEEYHYKMIIVADNKTNAIKKAKETAFINTPDLKAQFHT